MLPGFFLISGFVVSCTPGAGSTTDDGYGLIGTWLIAETARTTADSS